MALKHVDGFDQFQAQAGATLLSSLTAAGYTSSTGIAMASGRKDASYALELQVSAGAAGISWSSRTNALKKDLRGVAANSQGRWVAVGDAGGAVGSSDNLTWSTVVTGSSNNLKDIECNNDTYIVVGDNGTLLRSTDGRIFDQRPLPSSTVNLSQVAFGDGRWVAVGASGADGVILTSIDDGLTWLIAFGSPSPNICVAHGDNLWMIAGAAGQLQSSVNGVDWVPMVSGITTAILTIGYAAATWLLTTGNDVRRSSNAGGSWTDAAVDVIGTSKVNALINADGRWVLAGDGAQLRTSDDNGTTWNTPQLTGTTANFYGLGVSRGLQVGWCVVGAHGSGSAAIYVSLSPPTNVSRRFSTSALHFTIGFAHKSTARGRIASIAGLFDMDWAAGITILGQSGTAIPARNVWYYYELTIDKTALTVTLHINDQQDLVSPLPSTVAAKTDFDFSWIAENGAVTQIDDVYFVDAAAPAGELLVNRLGPISVPIRMPSEDVGNTWTPASPGPHYLQVGLLPPSPETFIRSSTSGAQDLFKSGAALPSDAGTPASPILAIGLMVLAQKGDIDNRQLGLVMGAAGVTQKEVLDSVLSTSPEYSYAVFEKAPGDVAWDAINTVNTPFGVVVRP